MADIDNLTVSVGGDISGLQAAFDAIPAAAETAAAGVQSAFSDLDAAFGTVEQQAKSASDAIGEMGGTTAGVEDSLAALSNATNDLDSSLTSVEDAANTVVPALDSVQSSANDAGDAVEHAGESAHEAEGGFSELAEQLVALGEALAVTEALKEFGEEALSAYAATQTATLALTALTNSAADANEQIENLKALSISDALSFPSVLKANQQFELMGADLDLVTKSLNAAADAGIGTTKGFDAIAQKMYSMALSGNASAKALTGLGLTSQDLAKQMGDVGISVDSTAQEVTAAFKSMDPTERLEAFDAAFVKYAGLAKASADTISGAFQVLKTSFELVMDEIGKALAPVITQIAQFISGSVLPYLKSMVDDFNALPTPIKNTAVEFGLLLAAIAPVAIAVGGFGLAVAGISAALGPLEAVGAAFVTFATVSVPEAIAAVGTFVTVTLPAAIAAVGRFSTVILAEAVVAMETFATTTIPATVAAVNSFAAALLARAVPSITTLAATSIPEAIAAFSTFATGALVDAGAALVAFATGAVASVTAALTTLATTAITTIAIPALAALGVAVTLAATAFVTWKLGSWLYDNVGFLRSFGDAIADVIIKIQSWILQSNLMTEIMAKMGNAQAQANLAMQQEAAAVSALSAKLAAHGVVIQQGSMTLDQYSVALRNAVDGLNHTATASDTAATHTAAVTISHKALVAALQNSENALAVLVNAYNNHNATADQVKAALDKVNAATTALNGPLGDLAKGHTGAADAAKTNAAAHAILGDQLKTFVGPVQQADFGIEILTGSHRNAKLAVDQLTFGIQMLTGSLPTLTSNTQSATGAAVTLGTVFQTTADKVAAAAAQMGTAIQGVTADVEQATAAVDDMGQAIASGGKKTGELIGGVTPGEVVVQWINGAPTDVQIPNPDAVAAQLAAFKAANAAATTAVQAVSTAATSAASSVSSLGTTASSTSASLTTSATALQGLQAVLEASMATLQNNLLTDTGTQKELDQQLIAQLNTQLQDVAFSLTTLQTQTDAAGTTLSTAADTLGSVLTATASTVSAAANTVATSFTAITKATPVPATVAYSPGSNTFTPILPTAAVPTIASGPGGSNAFTPTPQWQGSGGGILSVQVNVQTGVITGANSVQQFSDFVAKNVVTKLQQVGGMKMR